MDAQQLIDHLQGGNRIQKGGKWSDSMYALMLKCWTEEPSERPTFVILNQLLDDMAGSIAPLPPLREFEQTLVPASMRTTNPAAKRSQPAAGKLGRKGY